MNWKIEYHQVVNASGVSAARITKFEATPNFEDLKIGAWYKTWKKGNIYAECAICLAQHAIQLNWRENSISGPIHRLFKPARVLYKIDSAKPFQDILKASQPVTQRLGEIVFEQWYSHGNLHRLDGPASVVKSMFGDYINLWFVDGDGIQEWNYPDKKSITLDVIAKTIANYPNSRAAVIKIGRRLGLLQPHHIHAFEAAKSMT